LQRWPEGHEPQLPPQPSVPHTCAPQLGVQMPQVLGVPAPAQVSGSVHEPQLTLRPTPHRSVTESVPHVAPRLAQSSGAVSATQPQRFAVIAPHVEGDVQLPHDGVRAPPQRSVTEIEPQFAPAAEQSTASVSGAQHRFGVTAPHVPPLAHVPQSIDRVMPHPSVTVRAPQSAPIREQSVASVSPTHAHVPAVVH
jgi:hypothetical protein